MTLRGAPALTMIVLLGRGVQVKAQAPCAEVLRLRNAASEAWKHAMSAPASQRCGALAQASVATDAMLNYADNNRQSCNIFDRFLKAVDGIIGKRCRLATTFVLDVLFDHIRRTSSNANILLLVVGPVWSPFDWLRVEDR